MAKRKAKLDESKGEIPVEITAVEDITTRPYVALVSLVHMPTNRIVSVGESVDLSHLSNRDIYKLINMKTVEETSND